MPGTVSPSAPARSAVRPYTGKLVDDDVEEALCSTRCDT
jgi:hypothetical protein